MPTNLPWHDTVSLRKLIIADKENICHWMASAFIAHHSFVVPGPHAAAKDFGTYAYAERYFNLLMTDQRRQTYAIIVGREHVGTVGIKEIDKHHRAECFIDIGSVKHRHLGIGRIAMATSLKIAFEDFGLAQVALDVLEFNTAALRLYHGLGFVGEDCFIWHYDEFGVYWRVLKMNLLKSDWDNRNNEYGE